jgi:glycosyltransferase involved in cell wall biosynthesis
MPENVKISLVIPTRERAETLKYTIQTALNQKLQEYEVIVSDNFSQDNTKAVVDGFNDNRLKYINTMQRVSMTENFNFGVSHAKGDYIIIIGDDDGMMPNAVEELCKFIETHPSMLYTWPRHIYNWPSKDKESKLERIGEASATITINLHEKLRGTLKRGLLLNSTMPNTYHSATHRSVFERIKNETGRYHQTTNPDEFMLFVLPVFCECAVNIGKSLTVDGHSPKSNSGSFIHAKKKTKKNEDAEVDKFIKEHSNHKLHPSIPSGFPKTVSFVLDTFLVARDLYPKFYKVYRVNYSAMWAYGWQIFKLKNMLEPIKRRKELQVREPFNPLVYFIFSSLFFIYLRILKKVFPKSKQEKNVQKLFQKNPSKNIVEFVSFMDKHQRTNSKS